MSLIKKSDVKNHLSPRYRTENHVPRPADAAGSPVTGPDANKAITSGFDGDFFAEHSSRGSSAARGDGVTDAMSPQAPAASKSAQA
jgi:hypothetical protein